MKEIRSCFALLFGGALGVGLVIVVVMMLFTSCTQAVSNWRQSANHKVVAEQQTKQVETTQREETNRTGIEWDARTEIARIDAWARIRTSWAGLGHRWLDVLIGLFFVGAVVFFIGCFRYATKQEA